MNTDKLHNLIQKSNNILLISHINPDRDAIGSLLGLHHILKQLGKDSKMIVETPHTIRKGHLVGEENIIVGDLEKNLDGFDIVIILDTSVKKRFTKSKLENLFENQEVIVIDHHVTPPDIKHNLYLHAPVSSNAQLIYDIFVDKIELNQNIAKPLLMGMYDDTGGFRFPNVDSRTMRVTAELLDTGLNIADIAEESREMNAKLFKGGQHLMTNTKVDEKNRYFYSYFTREFIETNDYSYEDIEVVKDNFSAVLLSMSDADWGFIVKPKPDGSTSISFRSKKAGPDVERIAKIFGGGGHKKASGATLKESDPENAIHKIQSKVSS